MTKQEAAIIDLYTGFTMLKGEDRKYIYDYASKLLGRPIFTHEFLTLEEVLRERAKPDFIEICKNLNVSEWIYCKDRLPEKSETYLIAYDNNFFPDNSKKDIVYTVAPFDAESGIWNIKLAYPIIAWSSFQRISED